MYLISSVTTNVLIIVMSMFLNMYDISLSLSEVLIAKLIDYN